MPCPCSRFSLIAFAEQVCLLSSCPYIHTYIDGMAAAKSFPFKFKQVSQEEADERAKYWNTPFTCMGQNAVKTGPGEIIMPKAYEDLAEDLYNMEIRSDDVWIVTYPKCGTTWAQEMIWQIMHNFDVEGGKVPLPERFPYVEIEAQVKEATQNSEEMRAMLTGLKTDASLQLCKGLKSPRFIKSHLPLDMLPPTLLDTCKVIFVARSPKDVCVSYFHFHKLNPLLAFDGEFPEFAKMFKEGKLLYGDYFYHLEQAFKLKDHPNLKILWYEDMKKDLQLTIKETAKFLGKHLTELKVLQLDDHLYFDNFKKNPAVNMESISSMGKSGQSFMRKGQVGDWKRHFSPEDLARFDKWVQEKKQKHLIDRDF